VTLGVLSEQGGSLANLAKSGQDRRFVESYLARYTRHFEHVNYFSYANETADLPTGCTLVGNRWGLHRWVYAPLMPWLHAHAFRECAVIRVMQMTGEVPAILAKLIYRIPFIATYGYEYPVNARIEGGGRVRAALFSFRTRLAMRFADRVIVTTPRLRDLVAAEIGHDKLVFVPNGVDTVSFAPAEEPAPTWVPPVVLCVGRLVPVKNLSLLLDAVSRLERPVRVRLIGDGPERGALEQQARRLKVNLECPGVLPHQQLPVEFRRASVFAMLSRSEGHPKALLEAMSCGCICVGTDSEGIREVIRHGENGLLTAPAPDAVADALRTALDDAPLRARLSRGARALVEANYDLNRTLSAEILAIKELAQSRAC
jgi:glycosyltransferase involved in cell wall biosynthesis